MKIILSSSVITHSCWLCSLTSYESDRDNNTFVSALSNLMNVLALLSKNIPTAWGKSYIKCYSFVQGFDKKLPLHKSHFYNREPINIFFFLIVTQSWSYDNLWVPRLKHCWLGFQILYPVVLWLLFMMLKLLLLTFKTAHIGKSSAFPLLIFKMITSKDPQKDMKESLFTSNLGPPFRPKKESHSNYLVNQ